MLDYKLPRGINNCFVKELADRIYVITIQFFRDGSDEIATLENERIAGEQYFEITVVNLNFDNCPFSIECLRRLRPNLPCIDWLDDAIEQEIYETLLSLNLPSRESKILSACDVRPLDVLKEGFAGNMQNALRKYCHQGNETILLCECIHRPEEFDEDVYEDNLGEVTTVVEILHPGLYGDDVMNTDRPGTGSAYASFCEPDRQPLELNALLRQKRKQSTIGFDDATTVHVFETRQNMATYYTDDAGKNIIVD